MSRVATPRIKKPRKVPAVKKREKPRREARLLC